MQRTYHVVIEGISPLIQNNPEAAIRKMHENGKRRSSPASNPSEDWRIKVYLASDGKTLQHPSAALESVLKEAALSFKAKGRGSMKTSVKRVCFVDGEMMTITNKTEPDRVRELHPRNGQGQLVSSYYPEFAAGWKMEFWLLLTEDEILDPGHLNEILAYAGQRVGIGVGRPKYGRFIVSTFEEATLPKADKKKRAA